MRPLCTNTCKQIQRAIKKLRIKQNKQYKMGLKEKNIKSDSNSVPVVKRQRPTIELKKNIFKLFMYINEKELGDSISEALICKKGLKSTMICKKKVRTSAARDFVFKAS